MKCLSYIEEARCLKVKKPGACVSQFVLMSMEREKGNPPRSDVKLDSLNVGTLSFVSCLRRIKHYVSGTGH